MLAQDPKIRREKKNLICLFGFRLMLEIPN